MARHESDTVIEVSGLSRRFGHTEALRDVTLRVERGQVFGLVGENGAGKTTLIQHLLGAYTPQAGEVRVFGIDPTYDPTAVLARVGCNAAGPAWPKWANGRPRAGRLPLRGSRPAQVDARRRTHALHASFLPQLGSGLRRPSARGVSAS